MPLSAPRTHLLFYFIVIIFSAGCSNNSSDNLTEFRRINDSVIAENKQLSQKLDSLYRRTGDAAPRYVDTLQSQAESSTADRPKMDLSGQWPANAYCFVRIVYTSSKDHYELPHVYVSDIITVDKLNENTKYWLMDKVLDEMKKGTVYETTVDHREFYSYAEYASASRQREIKSEIKGKEFDKWLDEHVHPTSQQPGF